MRPVILPWPSRDLHPNARVHWARRAKAAKAARAAGYFAAMQAGWGHRTWPAGRLHLWIDFYPPDRRRRDDDGCLSAVKGYRDGIADAMFIDDVRFVSHPYVRDEVRKGGEVQFRVSRDG